MNGDVDILVGLCVIDRAIRSHNLQALLHDLLNGALAVAVSVAKGVLLIDLIAVVIALIALFLRKQRVERGQLPGGIQHQRRVNGGYDPVLTLCRGDRHTRVDGNLFDEYVQKCKYADQDRQEACRDRAERPYFSAPGRILQSFDQSIPLDRIALHDLIVDC